MAIAVCYGFGIVAFAAYHVWWRQTAAALPEVDRAPQVNQAPVVGIG
jgi:hypothetical protein